MLMKIEPCTTYEDSLKLFFTFYCFLLAKNILFCFSKCEQDFRNSKKLHFVSQLKFTFIFEFFFVFFFFVVSFSFIFVVQF